MAEGQSNSLSDSLSRQTEFVYRALMQNDETLLEDFINRTHEKINEAQKRFYDHKLTIQQDIQNFSHYITYYVQNRMHELKTDLENIAQDKEEKWYEGFKELEKAKALLRDFRQNPFDLCKIKSLEKILTQFVNFDFNDNKMEFIMGNMTAFKEVLQNLGKISINMPKFIIGSAGNESGQFCRPWGVCTDPSGRIIVSDRSNHRIQIFDPMGNFILKFGNEGSGEGEFFRPAGVAADSNFRIIVADKDNHRIQVFSYCGNFLFSFGREGSKIGEFIYPWDVATNQNCHIAVSDSRNRRVQLFNSLGVFLTKLQFDSTSIGLRKLDCPRGLAFLPNGDLLITDFNLHRILKVNQTFTKIMYMGKEGRGFHEFFRPQGIACDENGRIAVADSKNYRIQVFDIYGNIHKVFGRKGNLPGEFDCPQGIAFHPNGSLIVVELNNNQLQVF